MNVSVVMISYNVVKYIRQAIESVINQTLKDIEIIVVDKFSDDGTREIIKSYMKKDSRIRLINDIKGSAGYAYNVGIKEAMGEYVGFVETDDYVERDMYEKLYKIAVENKLDYIKGGFYFFVSNENGEECSRKHDILGKSWDSLYGEVINSNEFTELPLFDSQMWTGIYRRDYLIDNNILLNESKGAAFQDHGFQWQALMYADKCMYVKDVFYHYRKDNIAASMNNPKALSMDFAELEYIEGRLCVNKDMDVDYWRVFYTKVMNVLHYRLHQYFANGSCITVELRNVIKNYLDLLKKGEKVGFYDENTLDFDAYYEWKKIKQSLDGYLEYIRDLTITILEKEESLFDFVCSANKIVIFGNGVNGKNLYWLLYKNGYGSKVVAFCDNNPSNDEKNKSLEILTVSEAIERYPDVCYIVANMKWMSVMRRQLMKFGIAKDKIYIYKWNLPEWRIV